MIVSAGRTERRHSRSRGGVHPDDVAERPFEAEDRAGVAEMEVGPQPGPCRFDVEDWDRRGTHRPGEVGLGAEAALGCRGLGEFGFPQVPEGLDGRSHGL